MDAGFDLCAAAQCTEPQISADADRYRAFQQHGDPKTWRRMRALTIAGFLDKLGGGRIFPQILPDALSGAILVTPWTRSWNFLSQHNSMVRLLLKPRLAKATQASTSGIPVDGGSQEYVNRLGASPGRTKGVEHPPWHRLSNPSAVRPLGGRR